MESWQVPGEIQTEEGMLPINLEVGFSASPRDEICHTNILLKKKDVKSDIRYIKVRVTDNKDPNR